MLYVEGRADAVLARRLGVPRREIADGEDKGGVLKRLLQQRDCTGLVDEDPRSPQPGLLNRTAEVTTDDLRRLGLRLYRHGERGNTLIMLCPKLEDWLIEAARLANLRVNDRRYALPTESNSLRAELKVHPEKLDRLLDDLLSAQSPRLLRLKSLLTD